MNEYRPIALITGGSRGIGQQIAGQLAARGMTVLVGSRSARAARIAANELRNTGADAHPIVIDVTDDVSIRAAEGAIKRDFGRLDVLVNNAAMSDVADPASGYESTSDAPSSTKVDTVRAVYATNVVGVMFVTNTMLPLLRQSPAGRIVNVSSGISSFAAMSDPGGPFAALPPSGAYVPSKAALNALTIQYAKELRGTSILVNAADPGPCATELNPNAPRTPAQGARIAVRLATLDADGPTGGFFDEAGPVAW